MFILHAVALGVLLGFVTGGRASGLAALRFRWSAAIVAGLLVQVVLFSEAVAERVGPLGAPIYVGSTALVLAAVLRNVRITGMAVVLAGASSNLLAIVANGGYMPASPSAMASLGKSIDDAYSNSVLVTEPVLPFLTDVFAMPRWMPWANVFSVGDVLIGTGVVLVIVIAMQRGAAARAVRPSTDPAAVAG